MDQIEQTGGQEIDVDSLVEQIETGNTREIPMAAEAPKEEPQTQAQAIQELEFEVRGKPFKVPFNDPRLKQWTQQGYDYQQRMQEFTKRVSEIEAKEKQFQELESKFKPYREIDEYARTNPDWWKHVESQWQSRGQAQQDPNNPLVQELTQLKQELTGIKEFTQTLQEKEQKAKIEQEDTALGEEMKSIREKYANLDFQTPDAEGKNLEYRVLEYASQKGITDYTTAFLAFNHDRLVQIAKEQALAEVSKGQAKQKQAGVVGKTTSPTKTLSEVTNLKNKSYDNIHEEILQELGIA